VFYAIQQLYFFQGMFCHFLVLFYCLFKMAAYMSHAVDYVHVFTGLEGRFVAVKTVTLKITVEAFGEIFYYRAAPRAVVIVEEHQPLLDGSDQLEVFFVRPMRGFIHDRTVVSSP
jgi:hypothetical protein